jgi:hypothetical protein
MRTVETTVTVAEDGTLVLWLPPDIEPGRHRVVVVIEEHRMPSDEDLLDDLPSFDVGPWPADLSLRREDMYDNWGR